MKSNRFHISSLILLATLIFWLPNEIYGQEAESRPVRILINNLPEDTGPPDIKIMTPPIVEGEIYPTEVDVIDLIGEVSDQSGIKFVSVNSDIRSVNDAGIFSTRLQLVPGENKIRLLAADTQDNLNEKFITVWYKPPQISLAEKIQQNSTYYGLVIGIEKYEDPDLQNLENPIKDAEKLHRALLDNYTFNEGNIVLAGGSAAADNDDFAVVRFTPSGDVDTSFGVDGIVTADYGGTYDSYATDMAIQSDGKHMIVGYVGAGLYEPMVMRFNAGGSADTSFSGDGKMTINIGNAPGESCGDVVLQDDGKAVVATGVGMDGKYSPGIARLTTSGQLDTSFSGRRNRVR